jgi:hypothetical protein
MRIRAAGVVFNEKRTQRCGPSVRGWTRASMTLSLIGAS